MIFPVAATREAEPAKASPAVLMAPLAPRARPADLPARDRVDAAATPLPPALRPEGPADIRPVTIASRTTPVVPSARTAARPVGLTLAAMPTARARVERALGGMAALVAAPFPQAPKPVATPAGKTVAQSGPLRRSESLSGVAPEAAAIGAASPPIAASRPMPRVAAAPDADLPEAALVAREQAEAVQAERPPLATAALVPASPPEPRRIAPSAAKTASPRPIAVRAAVLAASAVPPAKAVAKPAPQAVAVVKPAPVAVAKAAPAPEPVRVAKAPAPTTSRAASEKVGLSRNSVSLIGVFGTSKERYALLRLPNGSVKRVGAGDSVQGVRVAAVSGDAVRLSQGQRDTILRMPD